MGPEFYAHSAEGETVSSGRSQISAPQIQGVGRPAENIAEPQPYYARWTDDRQLPQLLCRHLLGVANRAALLAKAARGGDKEFSAVAYVAGLLHDLGKYRLEFQAYLNAGDRGRKSIETAHSVYGAAAAAACGSLAVAFAVAGHHAGLHDECDLAILVGGRKFQAQDRWPQLARNAAQAAELNGAMPQMLQSEQIATSSLARIDFDDTNPQDARRFEFFVRMLFSLLVDADRLDSEKFEQEHRRKRTWERPARLLNPSVLLERLEAARREKAAASLSASGDLNNLRNSIFNACLNRGRNSVQGFFTLTVPTGGGKTLSSMAFALAHAQRHALDRVIVVIPYLSIIEQNARQYRSIFGADQVLEHHCAVELSPKTSSTREADESEPACVLDYERAVENWDVPIIVTTSVQFLESLFAAAPGRARKLHNIARSVVIFDEVQTLPTHLLEPTLDVLRTLQKQFAVSVLFCSATQPAFRKSANLHNGFRDDEVAEVAPDVANLFAKLQRVSFRIESPNEPWDWNRLAGEMLHKPQSLCIVNLRQHAFDAYTALRTRLETEGRTDDSKSAVFHLSSAMCAAHRLDILGLSDKPLQNNVKLRLDRAHPKPCWVVSTQLIEAGVDIDFPSVFRAMGPLDSIVQAAGRCNREGCLRDDTGSLKHGEVVVFHPAEAGLPLGIYKQATTITSAYLSEPERLATDPALFARYFTELYSIVSTDRVRRGENTIQQDREKLNFRRVAERARVISDDTVPVVVPYGRGATLIKRIRSANRIDFNVLRRLQRYMVNLRRGPKTLFQQLLDAGYLLPLLPEIDVLAVDPVCYDLSRGIVFRERPPEDFVL